MGEITNFDVIDRFSLCKFTELPWSLHLQLKTNLSETSQQPEALGRAESGPSRHLGRDRLQPVRWLLLVPETPEGSKITLHKMHDLKAYIDMLIYV